MRNWFGIIFLFCSSVSFASLPDFTELVEDTAASVVNISTVHRAQNNQHSPQYNPYYNGPNQRYRRQPQERASLGSGFIVSKNGYILTNNHVIDGADQIFVRLNDRSELEAELIGADENSDLALLKVSASDLPSLKIGKSEKLKVGEWVVAIGSPFGFDYSVTAGIVSAKGRSLPNGNYVPFIQTDVAINPGNSGGPLFNLDGEVVGINSQIYTRSGGFMGLSFAIPIDVAMEVVEQLKETGSVVRGWLGVVIQEVDKDLAESFGLSKAAGALVSQLVIGGPAASAGLQPGDIITKFNGKSVNLSSDLPHYVGRVRPGSVAKVAIIRNGKYKTLRVEIGTLPRDGVAQNSRIQPKTEINNNRLGVVVSNLTSGQKKQFDAEGVLVKSVNQGAGANAGLVAGDVITMIYGEMIRNMSDFNRVVKHLPPNTQLNMRIVRRGAGLFVSLRVSD